MTERKDNERSVWIYVGIGFLAGIAMILTKDELEDRLDQTVAKTGSEQTITSMNGGER